MHKPKLAKEYACPTHGGRDMQQIDREIIEDNKHLGGNFNYASSAAAVAGVYLSA